jgi:hypothetical protein
MTFSGMKKKWESSNETDKNSIKLFLHTTSGGLCKVKKQYHRTLENHMLESHTAQALNPCALKELKGTKSMKLSSGGVPRLLQSNVRTVQGSETKQLREP